MSKIWYITERPQKLKDYIFQSEKHKSLFETLVEKQNIPHLIFHGHRGTGKTSLAYILKNEFEIDDDDFIKINGSDDNSVDYVRSVVKGFISKMPFSSFKMVFFDEAENLSKEAQEALRVLSEEYAHNARFIFACNNINKIIPELQSRAKVISFNNLDKKSMMIKAANILKNNKIKGVTKEKLETYVDQTYPDFRQLLISLEYGSMHGSLEEFSGLDEIKEIFVKVVNSIEENSPLSVKEELGKRLLPENCVKIFELLFQYVSEIEVFSDDTKQRAAIVCMADYLDKFSRSSVPHLTLSACIIKLSAIGNN